MKRSMLFVLLTGAVLLVAACAMNEEAAVTEIVSINPVDESIGVAKTAAIVVEFSEPMDTSSCQSRYRLYQGELTSFPEGAMMGMMGMMGGQHGEPGQFHWNDDHTEMTFQPDSMLMDTTLYSICLGEGMQAHNHGGEMGMGMSGMMGHGKHTEGGVISHFQTGHD